MRRKALQQEDLSVRGLVVHLFFATDMYLGDF